jgi:hypothetical protein
VGIDGQGIIRAMSCEVLFDEHEQSVVRNMFNRLKDDEMVNRKGAHTHALINLLSLLPIRILDDAEKKTRLSSTFLEIESFEIKDETVIHTQRMIFSLVEPTLSYNNTGEVKILEHIKANDSPLSTGTEYDANTIWIRTQHRLWGHALVIHTAAFAFDPETGALVKAVMYESGNVPHKPLRVLADVDQYRMYVPRPDSGNNPRELFASYLSQMLKPPETDFAPWY